MAELITGYGVDEEETVQTGTESLTQYLTFQIADEMFAVEILDINEIIEVSQMTPVPMMPDFIRGVINLRGKVVPVLDLAARMGHGQSPLNKRSCIVLVDIRLGGTERQTAGMLVAAVNEIVEMDHNHIQPPPTMGEDVDTAFIKAMGRIGERFFILLDTDRILSHEEVRQIGQLHSYQDQHHQTESGIPSVDSSETD